MAIAAWTRARAIAGLRPQIVPGSESLLEVEMVIEALGQGISREASEALASVGLGGGGTVETRSGSCATEVEGVFAGGDLTNGGQTVVQAVAEGMKAAVEIDAFLRTSG